MDTYLLFLFRCVYFSFKNRPIRQSFEDTQMNEIKRDRIFFKDIKGLILELKVLNVRFVKRGQI